MNSINSLSWFKGAKYGLMIHLGLYSVLGGEYNKQKSCNYSEWIQSYFKIPNKEMENIAKNFNPKNFNANRLVKFAFKCGFKYIVITAKHHDGFCLFKSYVDDYNIVDFSKYDKDIVLELSNACKKYGIKFGIYYSQDLDWHEKNGGGFNKKVVDCAGSSWNNNWDFDDDNKDFNQYFYTKCIPQIKELLSNYGEISIFWFDVPFTLTKKQSKEIYDLIKTYQPNCLINSRLGNGCYDYVSFGDNEIPQSAEELTTVNSKLNDINGVKHSKFSLYEVCQTLNQSWGYTKFPKWKKLKELKCSKKKCKDLNINYLINIGPDANGNLPKKAKILLKNLMK